jgi:hypothetical protein
MVSKKKQKGRLMKLIIVRLKESSRKGGRKESFTGGWPGWGMGGGGKGGGKGIFTVRRYKNNIGKFADG